MSADPYSTRVRELFATTPHAGDLAGAETVSTVDHGVRIALAATAADNVLTAMRFRAWGCPHLIAAAETACAALEGQPIAALANWTAAEVMENLPVPVEKTGRILVLEDTVRSLGQRLCERT